MDISFSIFDALHPVTIVVWTLILMTSLGLSIFNTYKRQKNYQLELCQYENASEISEKTSEPPKEPDHGHLITVFCVSIIMLGGLAAAGSDEIDQLERTHHRVETLIKEASENSLNPHPVLSEWMNEWDNIADHQKRYGDINKYGEIYINFMDLFLDGIATPEDYALAKELKRTCFKGSISNQELEVLMSQYPINGEAFIEAWRNAAYETAYRTDTTCKPENVFGYLELDSRLY